MLEAIPGWQLLVAAAAAVVLLAAAGVWALARVLSPVEDPAGDRRLFLLREELAQAVSGSVLDAGEGVAPRIPERRQVRAAAADAVEQDYELAVHA